MAKWISSVAILVMSFALTSCGANNTPNSATNNNTKQNEKTATYLSICQLSYGNVGIVCIDFPNNSPMNSTSCANSELFNYQGFGVNHQVYESSSPGAISASCAQMNAGLTRVGTCTLADRYIRYYDSAFSVATAQANCLQRTGTWSQ